MNETYTIKELLSGQEDERDYPVIRMLAGEILNPGPWKHDPIEDYWLRNSVHEKTAIRLDIGYSRCSKCGETFQIWDCNEAVRAKLNSLGSCEFPLAAEGPLEVITERLVRLCLLGTTVDVMERAACCLLVLLPEKVKVGR